MAKESKGYGWPILGIVGIVAIVGLAILFTDRSFVATQTASTIPEISEEQIEETSGEGSLVGQAYVKT